jgi:hypothetical protein
LKNFRTQWVVAITLFVSLNQALAFAEPSETSSPITEDPASNQTVIRGPIASPLDFGLDFQFLPARYPNYQYTTTAQSNRMGMGGRLGFDWLPVTGRFGKGGLGGGAGYTKISNVDIGTGSSWLETFPLDVYLTYRFDYLHDQALVPFVKGGFEKHFARQQAGAALSQYNGWNVSAGLAILLDWVDRASAQQLDNSTGINNTYVTMEYLMSRRAGSETAINLVRDEVRLGLRFEM